jgi:hypothetical protein
MIREIVIGSQHSSQALSAKRWSVDIHVRTGKVRQQVGSIQCQGTLPDQVTGHLLIESEKVNFSLSHGQHGLEWASKETRLAGVTVQLSLFCKPRIKLKLGDSDYTLTFPRTLDTWKRRVNTSVEVSTAQGTFSVCPFPSENRDSQSNDDALPFFDAASELIMPADRDAQFVLLGTALIGFAFYYP